MRVWGYRGCTHATATNQSRPSSLWGVPPRPGRRDARGLDLGHGRRKGAPRAMTYSSKTSKGLVGLIALVALMAMVALPATASAQAIGAGEDCTPTDAQYQPPTDILECDD